MKYIFVTEPILSNSDKSTAITIATIGKKLQDLDDRVTGTNTGDYSNEDIDSGSLVCDKFCEIFVCHDT